MVGGADGSDGILVGLIVGCVGKAVGEEAGYDYMKVCKISAIGCYIYILGTAHIISTKNSTLV